MKHLIFCAILAVSPLFCGADRPLQCRACDIHIALTYHKELLESVCELMGWEPDIDSTIAEDFVSSFMGGQMFVVSRKISQEGPRSVEEVISMIDSSKILKQTPNSIVLFLDDDAIAKYEFQNQWVHVAIFDEIPGILEIL